MVWVLDLLAFTTARISGQVLRLLFVALCILALNQPKVLNPVLDVTVFTALAGGKSEA